MMKRFCKWALSVAFVCVTPHLNADQCCDEDQCDALASACCPDDCGTLYAGVEATYLAPIYDSGAAAFTFTDPLGPATITLNSTFGSASERLEGAPRINLGYVGQSGLGWQARYWELTAQESVNGIPAPILGNQVQTLGGDDRFNAYTIDLELTKDFCRRNWSMVGTFGVRHAKTSRNRVNNMYGAINGDVFNLASYQREHFSGTGLTFSLSGLKTINRCRCLSLYVNGRGSTVFGEANTSAITHSSFSGPGGAAGSTNGAVDEDDTTMFIGEVGLGLQWSRYVRSFNGRMFARIGGEYQYWGGSDGNAIAVSASGSPGFSLATASAVGGEQNSHLVGLTLATGFAW